MVRKEQKSAGKIQFDFTKSKQWKGTGGKDDLKKELDGVNEAIFISTTQPGLRPHSCFLTLTRDLNGGCFDPLKVMEVD